MSYFKNTKERVFGQRNDPTIESIDDGVNTISYPEQRRPPVGKGSPKIPLALGNKSSFLEPSLGAHPSLEKCGIWRSRLPSIRRRRRCGNKTFVSGVCPSSHGSGSPARAVLAPGLDLRG